MMTPDDRLMIDILNVMQKQSGAADDLITILLDDAEYVSKNPILSLAVMTYMQSRSEMSLLAGRVKDSMSDEEAEAIMKDWEAEKDD